MRDHISTEPRADQGIPLNQLVLVHENVRKSSADKSARADFRSIRAHGLLENLVILAQVPDTDDGAR